MSMPETNNAVLGRLGEDRPVIVCLCGSTRFKREYVEANFRETMAGRIVLSVGWFSHADKAQYNPTPDEETRLDDLHLRKIELADEILVLNGLRNWCARCNTWYELCPEQVSHRMPHVTRPYVGESTRREISHARALGKPIRWLHPPGKEES